MHACTGERSRPWMLVGTLRIAYLAGSGICGLTAVVVKGGVNPSRLRPLTDSCGILGGRAENHLTHLSSAAYCGKAFPGLTWGVDTEADAVPWCCFSHMLRNCRFGKVNGPELPGRNQDGAPSCCANTTTPRASCSRLDARFPSRASLEPTARRRVMTLCFGHSGLGTPASHRPVQHRAGREAMTGSSALQLADQQATGRSLGETRQGLRQWVHCHAGIWKTVTQQASIGNRSGCRVGLRTRLFTTPWGLIARVFVDVFWWQDHPRPVSWPRDVQC
jgi:hypothetical protein